MKMTAVAIEATPIGFTDKSEGALSCYFLQMCLLLRPCPIS